MLLAASMAGAQTAADHIALGDKEYVAMNAPAALQHYEEAIKLDPKNYEALWKASRSDVDLGSYEQNGEKRGLDFRMPSCTRVAPSKPTRATPRGISILPGHWGKTR
jgi:hypothetical protein